MQGTRLGRGFRVWMMSRAPHGRATGSRSAAGCRSRGSRDRAGSVVSGLRLWGVASLPRGELDYRAGQWISVSRGRSTLGQRGAHRGNAGRCRTAERAAPAGTAPSSQHVNFSFARADRPWAARAAMERGARGVSNR